MASERKGIQRHELADLAKSGAILDAAFIAGDFGDKHGFILNIEFGGRRAKQRAVLAKQDGKPRLFVTPQTCTKNAQKLGLKLYRFDTTNWNPQHYDPYDAQVRSHRKKREQARKKAAKSR